jgi:hypothetical protein
VSGVTLTLGPVRKLEKVARTASAACCELPVLPSTCAGARQMRTVSECAGIEGEATNAWTASAVMTLLNMNHLTSTPNRDVTLSDEGQATT